VPYGYLLVDLTPDQDEQCCLRTLSVIEVGSPGRSSSVSGHGGGPTVAG